MSFRNKKRRIGVYGGTFDPVHTVHLIVAERARDVLALDEIWLMPARIPPHKQNKVITADRHRVEMLRRAVAGNSCFQITTIELDTQGSAPSYTYDTMSRLTAAYKDVDFFFIIGGDMVEYLPKWHRVDELLRMVQFVALARPGYSMNTPYREWLIEVDMPQLDVASSQVRDLIRDGHSIRYLVPEAVRLYIEENELYES
ncbi:nicotinate-nucleotide adenylyltransferase [Aneurinibacillus soli]|uniref:Probable nicotinate-nucleotide adenylyltransferase n=1 Tax=Aneurinibacillus soli TaxID=1500254 RepID=A0A0U5ATR6_9BACL|nr:nicotinate-nucleotide adenylyltransferase [Aneurinibacillus soli]PYE62584.1 nicotinate-nucleotide adenylyltransferase [Aneurinibacillus soli]BAU27146.1 Nicotinate-nucleotide adenylyltransferase [Aneurinibacillus soli]